MKVHTITFLASSISGLSLIACLFVICHIYTDVQNIWDELDQEIYAFRLITNDMWQNMMQLSAKKVRDRRQAAYDNVDQPKTGGNNAGYDATPNNENYNSSPKGFSGPGASSPGVPFKTNPPSIPPALSGGNGGPGCNCATDNKCPAGPPGPKGVNGHPGLAGLPGLDGIPGKDAEDISPEHQDSGVCYTCPQGPPGSPGPIGRPGQRGLKGADGQPGLPGRDGNPGTPGEQGPQGPAGHEGPAGPLGEKGRDAEKPIGRPGLKGARGIVGPAGPPGDFGQNGAVGIAGPQGPPGSPGNQGAIGIPGEGGLSGLTGRPGKDAEYCPCPPKSGAGISGGVAGGKNGGYRQRRA